MLRDVQAISPLWFTAMGWLFLHSSPDATEAETLEYKD